MYEITRKHWKGQSLQTKTYRVLTKQEADNEGIEYKSWRDLNMGDTGWVLSDDGYVSEIIRLKEYYIGDNPDKENMSALEIVLPFASKLVRKNRFKNERVKIEFMPHWKTKCWGSSPNSDWHSRLKNRRWRWFATTYAIMTINGYVDYSILGQIVRPDHKKPGIFAKNKMKNEKVKELCMEAVADLLERKGAGKEKAIDSLLKAAQFAEATKSSKDMLAVAKTLIELNSLEPVKVKTTEELDGDYSGMIEGGAVKGKISGTRVIERTETQRDEYEESDMD